VRHYSLRGKAADAGFMAACESALGARPPLEPNTVDGGILWLGPDEWLVVTDKVLSGTDLVLVDVTASRQTIDVAGPQAEETLSKAATLDFHVKAFPVGSCAQTNIARTQGILHRLDVQHFRIYVRTSFARYLRAWLDDAAR
jgi:sarcosine oxidase subunit gamma